MHRFIIAVKRVSKLLENSIKRAKYDVFWCFFYWNWNNCSIFVMQIMRPDDAKFMMRLSTSK